MGENFLSNNRLTLIRVIPERNNKGYIQALYRCSCGNKSIRLKSKVERNITRSCGCLLSEMRHSFGTKYKLPNQGAQLNELYASYKRSAKLRGLSFDIAKDSFNILVKMDCLYCGETPIARYRSTKGYQKPLAYNGIDRVNNNIGYEESNCVPCCKRCNIIKSNLSSKELILHLRKMVDRHNMWERIS